MKKTIIKTAMLGVTGLALVTGVKAQETSATGSSYYSGFRTWSIGANVGVTTPSVIVGGQNDFSNAVPKLAYGLYLKKQLSPNFSLRLDGTMGNVSGDNSKAFEGGRNSISSATYSAFDTKFLSGSVSAVANLLNLNLFKQQNAAQLYASAGLGVVNYETTLTPKGGSATQMYSPDKINELTVPVGVGAKFKLSDGINLDLAYTMNFVDADNFDGVWAGGKSDKYAYASAGLEFALGKGKKQLAFHNPTAVAYADLAKAKQAAEAATSALEAQKKDNAALRSDLDALSKDEDNDGVSDKFDKCPGTEAGTAVDGSGCPLPKVKAVAPTVIQKTIVTKEDRLIVANAIKNLEFDLSKATIRAKSFPSLDRVAQLLSEKGFSLTLSGYTDNTGSMAINQQLSNERANAVKDYLVSKGADALKISAKGYGPANPIASNKTAAGRQKNRRVEFTLAN